MQAMLQAMPNSPPAEVRVTDTVSLSDKTNAALTPLYIFGASSQGLVVAEAATASGLFEVAGFIDDKVDDKVNKAAGAAARRHGHWPVFGRKQVAPSSISRLIIGVGDNAARARLSQEMIAAGWIMASVIHPSVWVSPSSKIGDGVYVGPQAAINAQAQVEEGVIINTGVIVEHHCVVKRFAHLCPRTALAGNVTIGQMTTLGTGVSVCPRINIGRDCVIGAGAAVANDIADGRLAMGVPARCRPD